MSSRTVGFPQSGWRPWLSPGSLPSTVEAQVLAHVHPSRYGLLPGSLTIFCGPPASGSVSGGGVRPSTAMAESPFALLGRYPARGRVPTTSVGVTRPSSLLRAHAPDHAPPLAYGPPSVWGSVQVAASPCCDVVLPDVISACLSLDAWTLTPAAWWVPLPITSPPPSAFPQSSWVGSPRQSVQRLPNGR